MTKRFLPSKTQRPVFLFRGVFAYISDLKTKPHFIAHPRRHFDKPLKIVISRLKQVARSDVISHDYKLSSLLERLAAGGASQSQGRRIEHWT